MRGIKNIEETAIAIYCKEFRGYVPAKITYTHGLRLHIVASSKGFTKELVITSASFHDIKGIYLLTLDLSKESVLYADKAYNDYRKFFHSLLLVQGVYL
ncbi:transposase [Aquifex sp.]